jgi:predicted RecB family nuclease
MTKKVTPKKQDNNFPKLSAPAQRALAGAGVQTLEDLAKFSEKEVKQWHGIGPNAIEQLRQALAANGLSFAREKIKET